MNNKINMVLRRILSIHHIYTKDALYRHDYKFVRNIIIP